MIVVISQPMLFPWVGLLEQMRAADVYVRYPDVQFSKGSFVNRVQIKTPRGMRWLTVPLRDHRLGQRINEVRIDGRKDWKSDHVQLLRDAYADAPHAADMLAMVESVYSIGHDRLDSLAVASEDALYRYFQLPGPDKFISSESLRIGGGGSRRVLDIVLSLGGKIYLTGHGASRYLDHGLFEEAGLQVQYMDYARTPYAQLHGAFTPYVPALDLVANMGPGGAEFIRPKTKHWKDFLRDK